MKSGTIALYDQKGNFVTVKYYDSKPARRKIIEEWSLMYGKGFKNCFYQIEPEIDLQDEKYKAA